MKNIFKKFVFTFLIMILSGLTLLFLLVYIIDPYFQYHKPIQNFNYIIDDQLTQNPGLARNLEYDAVILGSSVTVNFDAAWFNEDFDVNTIKLPYNGAYPKDYANIISQIELSNNELKYVFWTMDVGSFSGEINETKYPIKKNLYDKNPFNDYSYFLNKEVLFKYIINPALNRNPASIYNNQYSNKANNKDLESNEVKLYDDTINNAYATYKDLKYEREACLNNFFSVNPDINKEKALEIIDNGADISILAPAKLTDDNQFLEAAKANMEINILPFIENHPSTKFIISFPPYSILNRMIYVNNGSYNAYMKEMELVKEMLSKYDNVIIHDFSDENEIIYNLDLYADAIHFNRDISYYIEQTLKQYK